MAGPENSGGGKEHAEGVENILGPAYEVGVRIGGMLEKAKAYGDAADSVQSVIPEIIGSISAPGDQLKVVEILSGLVTKFLNKAMELPEHK